MQTATIKISYHTLIIVQAPEEIVSLFFIFLSPYVSLPRLYSRTMKYGGAKWYLAVYNLSLFLFLRFFYAIILYPAG